MCIVWMVRDLVDGGVLSNWYMHQNVLEEWNGWTPMFTLIFSACVHKQFLLFNILPEFICIWNNVYEICAKAVLEKTFLCAPNFLCALISRPVSTHSLEGTLLDTPSDRRL